MAGPLQAFLEEERLFKEKLKEKQRESEHRTLRDIQAFMSRRSEGGAAPSPRGGSGQSPHASASKKVNSGSRRSTTPTPSSSSRDPHYDKLSRPTSSSSKMHATAPEKRQTLSPRRKMDPPEREHAKTIASVAESEKWDAFLNRISSKKQEKDKYLETMRKKKEMQDMLACTFEPEISKLGRSIKGKGSMLDRQKEMEARKAQKLKQMRQDQFDKEMSQCSFQPSLTARARSRDGGGLASSRISSRNSSLRRGYNRRPVEQNDEDIEESRESRLASNYQIETAEDFRLVIDKVNELVRNLRGNEYWDDDASPIPQRENNEEVEAFEATLLPYTSRDREKQDVDEDSLSNTTIIGDQHEDASDSQFEASLSTINFNAEQSHREDTADSELKAASLTPQSPGVQGFAAAIRRRSSAGRQSQVFSFSESPSIYGSTENGASPASTPLSHGLLRRASLREQPPVVDSAPDIIEDSFEAPNADFP